MLFTVGRSNNLTGKRRTPRPVRRSGARRFSSKKSLCQLEMKTLPRKYNTFEEVSHQNLSGQANKIIHQSRLIA